MFLFFISLYFYIYSVLYFFVCFQAVLVGNTPYIRGFPNSSVGKESTCNAGDRGSPGLGKSTGEGIGYPLQYSWASPVAQLIKNPLAMQET